MTERQTAYERTEAIPPRAVLCIPTVMRFPGGDTWRSWIEIASDRRRPPLSYAYLMGDPVLVTPYDSTFKIHWYDGTVVPWERVPEAIRQHVMHVISEEIEA